MLIVYRVLTSAGIACCTTMTSSVMADYPQNATRGKFIGANGVITAFAIVGISAFGLARLPEFFAARGYDTVAAGNATYWIAGSLALASAFISFAGLKDVAFLKVEARTGLLNKARNGLAEILRNSRLSLGCGATFVSRGDLTVLAAFFSLWLINVGTDMGMETGEAATKAGMLFGLSQIVVPFFVPIVAIAVDRIDRVTTLAMAMALAAGGYFALGLVPNPLESWLIYPAAIVTGLGEAAVIISTPALVGQEAPAKMRGSIIGVVALSGALGVLVNIKVSGLLFDNWMYQGPFIYMGFLNVAIAVWAVLVRVATK
jgi:MFS family permease